MDRPLYILDFATQRHHRMTIRNLTIVLIDLKIWVAHAEAAMTPVLKVARVEAARRKESLDCMRGKILHYVNGQILTAISILLSRIKVTRADLTPRIRSMTG